MSEIAGRLTLTSPIRMTFRSAGGDREETITEVTVRPMVVGDLRATAKIEDETLKALAMVGRLTGLESEALDRMGVQDFAAVTTLIEGFTLPGLATGGMPPA